MNQFTELIHKSAVSTQFVAALQFGFATVALIGANQINLYGLLPNCHINSLGGFMWHPELECYFINPFSL
jgi:hypothetical protein